MSKIVEYYNSLSNDPRQETLSKTFINFYLYFKKLHEKKALSNNTIYFLDAALDFSEPVFENSHQTEEYLNAKQFQIEQFLIGFKLNYNKIIKTLKKTFDIPDHYSYEDVCDLILQSYIVYASLRYKHNLLNTKVYEETFTIEKIFYKLPKYIPDTNANISEFLDMVGGVKRLAQNGTYYEWFNVFSDILNIRVIVDIADGQIAAVFVNGEEYTDVPSSFIKKLKQHIKNGTPFPKTPAIPSKK